VAILIILALILGLIPAFIASGKGHSFFWWWVFGAVIFIVALPFAFLSKDMRARCPECAEPVKSAAVKCPHCQSEIGGRLVIPAPVR
jgi:DNA-directed RNA polymerase subunit RPC12/RpoP